MVSRQGVQEALVRAFLRAPLLLLFREKPFVEAYGLDVNRLGDLEVMALAKARGLTVVSLESQKQHRADRPKIPNVCAEFGIRYCGFHDFLREEGFADLE